MWTFSPTSISGDGCTHELLLPVCPVSGFFICTECGLKFHDRTTIANESEGKPKDITDEPRNP